jgi:CBS domain-containing protein
MTREMRSPADKRRLSPGAAIPRSDSKRRRFRSWEGVRAATERRFYLADRPQTPRRRLDDRLGATAPTATPDSGIRDAVRIQEIMTGDVVTAAPDEPAHGVAALMRDRNVGSVVLVDEGGRPVGMLTDRDLTIDLLADSGDPESPAESFATVPVVTGRIDMDLEEAAALMVSHRIRRLPVMDGEDLVGIVTLDDIAVRTGNIEIAQQMTADVARAVFPEFYFHQRGG